MRRNLFVFLALCLTAAAAGWARSAPDFSLPGPNGKQVRLSEQRGKLVVIEFLQTGCPACQSAGRVLRKLYAQNQNANFMVIGITHTARGMPAILEYTEQHGLTYPVLLGDMPVAVNYLGITPLRPQFHVPVFFFVGPDGQLLEERNPDRAADRDWFANMEQNLEATVRRLLAAHNLAKPARRAPARKRKTAERKPEPPQEGK